MRDRLIELLKQKACPYVECDRECGECKNVEMYEDNIENIADHLLANNVIVFPIKVGDMVYILSECSCENIDGVHTECEFYGYGEDDRICNIPNGAKCPYQYRIEKCTVTEFNLFLFSRLLGNTAFLSLEEAEKDLERSKS